MSKLSDWLNSPHYKDLMDGSRYEKARHGLSNVGIAEALNKQRLDQMSKYSGGYDCGPNTVSPSQEQNYCEGLKGNPALMGKTYPNPYCNEYCKDPYHAHPPRKSSVTSTKMYRYDGEDFSMERRLKRDELEVGMRVLIDPAVARYSCWADSNEHAGRAVPCTIYAMSGRGTSTVKVFGRMLNGKLPNRQLEHEDGCCCENLDNLWLLRAVGEAPWSKAPTLTSYGTGSNLCVTDGTTTTAIGSIGTTASIGGNYAVDSKASITLESTPTPNDPYLEFMRQMLLYNVAPIPRVEGFWETRQTCEIFSAIHQIIKPKKTSMIGKITMAVKKMFDKDTRNLMDAGWMGECSTLTSEGCNEFQAFLVSKFKAEFAALAAEKIAEDKAEEAKA